MPTLKSMVIENAAGYPGLSLARLSEWIDCINRSKTILLTKKLDFETSNGAIVSTNKVQVTEVEIGGATGGMNPPDYIVHFIPRTPKRGQWLERVMPLVDFVALKPEF